MLEAALAATGRTAKFENATIGGAALDATGSALPPATLELCRGADAVLLGAVGGPKWDNTLGERPELGLLTIRKELGLFANLRPVRPHPRFLAASPLKAEKLTGVDILFVRELTGGIYFGEKQRNGDVASDLCIYSKGEIERVVRVACRLAGERRGMLTSVDKANVLETSRLWRETTERVVRDEFTGIELEHVLVDAMAMFLLQRPGDFDVVVTENMFGDILTDEASVLPGSLGLMPSASLGKGKQGLYEPVHGSAPDIAGKGIANPYAAILSGAMMLRYSLELGEVATAVENAVWGAVEAGALTPDLGGTSTTVEVTATVVERLG